MLHKFAFCVDTRDVFSLEMHVNVKVLESNLVLTTAAVFDKLLSVAHVPADIEYGTLSKPSGCQLLSVRLTAQTTTQ